MMTCKNAVKVASLLAVVLLAVPAFAGEAIYNSSHTAANTQIQSNVAAGVGCTGANCAMLVTYNAGIGIDIDITGSTGDFDFTDILDSTGGELNTPLNEAVHVEYTIVSATVPNDATGGIGLYIDIPNELDGANNSQVNTGVRNDGSGGVFGFMGAHAFGNWQNTNADVANIYVQTATEVTFPAEFVIDISAGGVATLTINGTEVGSIDLNVNGVRLAQYRQRLFKSCPGCGAGNFGGGMVIDDILISGNSIPDVNQGPTLTITRVGAADSAFTDTTGSWTVEFGEAVTGVSNDDFSLFTTGTAAASGGPTLSGASPSFTVDITGVSGTGSIGLNFLVNDVVATATSLAPAAQNNAAFYTNVVPAPAAMGWVLVFLGVVLALAAAVVIRRKALKH